MKLLEYMNQHPGEEIAVHDKYYEMESYFYGDDPEMDEDDWDKAVKKIASILDVEEIETEPPGGGLYVAGVTVNMSDVIERNLKALKESELFIVSTVDAIMSDMPNILSGYVSEKWMTDFADTLEKSERNREKPKNKDIGRE